MSRLAPVDPNYADAILSAWPGIERTLASRARPADGYWEPTPPPTPTAAPRPRPRSTSGYNDVAYAAALRALGGFKSVKP